ncbi:MAG TPA: hypothetical protein VHM01_19220 [Alphaproteobacteria bacterium]|nr:hypothetical protein [Alphaproteobacteria bacterium]
MREEPHTAGGNAAAAVRYCTPLGLDARLPAAQYLAREWTAQRRELFLLRPDIEQPLSVDRLVWPSLFRFPGDYVDAERAASPAAEGLSFGEVALRLWRDRRRLESALNGPGGATASAVRIDLLTEPGDRADDAWQILNVVPEPLLDGSEIWPLAGHDVADASLLSGLMNCGYSQPERKALRPVWSAKLNRAGLFNSAEDAFAFRAVTDARVPEHAPFFVFAIRVRSSLTA